MIYDCPILKVDINYADEDSTASVASVASVDVKFLDGSFSTYDDEHDIIEVFERLAVQQAGILP